MITQEEFEAAEVGQVFVCHLGHRYAVTDVWHIPMIKVVVVALCSEKGKTLVCMWWDRIGTLPDRKKHLDLSLFGAHVENGGSP